jgi:2-dehydropantoate 2-reductase
MTGPPTDWPKKITIVGSGAVGGYYGARLAQAGHQVHFLVREPTYTAVKNHGWQIRSLAGDFTLTLTDIASLTTDTRDIGPSDLVIIALKTTQNDALLTHIPPLLNERTTLLTLQNGLGADDFLAHHFGPARVLGGLCFVCLNTTAPGHIWHQAQGRIALGAYLTSTSLDPRLTLLSQHFTAAHVPCTTVTSLAQARWEKLLWNIPYNGLSIAAGGLDTAALMADPHWRLEIRALMEEVLSAAATLDYPIDPAWITRHLTATAGMGSYRPSSLIDYQSGRPVEIEALWGEPLRRAQAAGATTPRLEKLYHQLLRLVPITKNSAPLPKKHKKLKDSIK